MEPGEGAREIVTDSTSMPSPAARTRNARSRFRGILSLLAVLLLLGLMFGSSKRVQQTLFFVVFIVVALVAMRVATRFVKRAGAAKESEA